MEDEKIELIAAYEISHNIPNINRYTEYVEEYNCNMNKLGIAPEFIEKRYQEALNEKKAKEVLDPACVLVLEVTMSHNLKDVAKFTLDNLDNMLEQFYNSSYKERKVGYKEKDKEPVYLLSYRENLEYPEILSPDDIEHINLRQEWFIKVVELKNKSLMEDTKNIIARANSSLSAKQDKFNYDKEIKKRMQINKKVFMNERMEGYDFRAIDLDSAIFINCFLKDCNFAHVNMQNVCFVNCDLDGAIYLGAVLNNAYSISGSPIKIIDTFKNYGGEN